jgi:hypothetical protein
MTQILLNLRVKLSDTKGIKVFLLCNNIENDKKTLHLPVSFFLIILRIKRLYYYIFLIEKYKTNLKYNFKN